MHCWKFCLLVLEFVSIGHGLPCNMHVPDASGESVRCQLTLYPFCKNLGYNETHFPNLFNHTRQSQAMQLLNDFNLNDSCSQFLSHFLCSAAFPFCARGLFQRIVPCREMCVLVRESCGHIFNQLDINCNMFQRFAQSNTPCIWNASDCSVANDRAMSTSTDGQPPRSRGRTNCTGHLAMLPNIPQTRDDSFAGVSHCTESCQGVYFDREQRNLIVIWITAWSLLTLFVSAVMFLTYILNFRSILSLEAPIYYISLSCAITALCYTLSVAIGSNSLICDSEFTNQFNESAVVVDGLTKPLCVSIFGLLYYFTACTWSWWAVLCIQWLMCSLRVADVSNSWKPCLHIAGWGLPLPFVVFAIALKHVSGDPILHTCWIKKHQELPYLIVPLSLCLLWCSIIIIVCFARVVKLQKFSKQKTSDVVSQVDHQTLVRVGLYCTVYTLPMGLLLCVYFYEYWFREQWEIDHLRCTVLRLGDCTNRTVPLLPLFLAKLTASLLMGIVSVFWMFRGSTVAAWKKVCCFCMTSNHRESACERHSPNSTPQLLEQRQPISNSLTSQKVTSSTTHKHTKPFNSESPL